MTTGKSLFCLAGTWLLGVTAFAQTVTPPLKFEVASVKPADPHFSGVSSSRDAGEGLDVRNISVRNLITLAYGIRDFQLKGGPGWIDSESYDVIAKAPGGDAVRSPGTPNAAEEPMDQRRTRFERVRERLRSLLADRFGLVVHHETREQPVYLLTVARNGPKLIPVSAPTGPPRKEEGRGHSRGFAVPIEMIVVTLSDATHLTVIDKTGLSGRFDYTLNWDPASASLNANPETSPSDTPGPTIFSAVQEQLGLRLEPGKRPGDVIVIDHIDHPSAN
jgi:bla regulator protein blaR1